MKKAGFSRFQLWTGLLAFSLATALWPSFVWSQQAVEEPAAAEPALELAPQTAAEDKPLEATLPPPEAMEDLPGVRELAAALSDPSSRDDALLTLIALSRLPPLTPGIDPNQLEAMQSAFREDRAWLDRLSKRYAVLPARGTIFDPAAWFIAQELGQHPVEVSTAVSPLGPEYQDLLWQMFDRSDERLAATFIPEAVVQSEFVSTRLWSDLLLQAQTSAGLRALLLQLNADWFDPWAAAEPPAPISQPEQSDVIEQAMQSLKVLASVALLPAAPDALRLKRLRFDLLTQLPELPVEQDRTARHILRLASGLNGLYEQHYLGFIESLLWVVTDLLEVYARDARAYSPLPLMLAEYLPQLSAVMARNFADVDPRFNANLAAVFDVAQDLHSSELTPQRFADLHQELADSITQLVLLVPEMAFYFDQPVRKKLSEEIDICISVAAARDSEGKPTLTREQFDGCLKSMTSLVDGVARSAEIAGDLDGPFGADQMRRELELMPSQRINYALGYLHEQEPAACALPERPLPNPLEWAALATLMTWFSEQVPVYLQTPENEALVVRMRQQGLTLVRQLARQIDCISGSGTGVNDLLRKSMVQYRTALGALASAMRRAELEFREARLRPGADIMLGGTVDQNTAYRSQDTTILPCDSALVCEMSQPLEATRALIGLFPSEYLLADQTGLGTVEICYENLQWVDRRSELVRPDDPNVANYHGRLSFDLVGRYREGDSVQNIFGSNFVSPEEHHYLFGAASDQVLAAGCPTEWVGQKIVTKRTKKRLFNVVPDRLTYLSAARSKPSDVISANWSRGAEWRDWFITGIGVTPLSYEPDESITDRLAQHMRVLYLAEQQSIYSTMLRPPARTAGTLQEPLFDLLNDVSMYKSLLRAQLILFYPSLMLDSDEIRAAIEGQNGLLDEIALRRFQDNGVAIGQIKDIGLARLEDFQASWDRQPESMVRAGSVDASVAHGITRLNALYRKYFAAPQVLPAEVTPTVTPPSTESSTNNPIPEQTAPQSTALTAGDGMQASGEPLESVE